jgi:hypothetical protein
MSLPNSQLCCSRSGLVIFEASHLFSCSYIVSGKAKHFACSNQWVIRSETIRFHTANGQQEAKRFASIPAIYAIFVLTCMQEAKQLASTQTMGNKKRNVSLPFPQYMLFLCWRKILLHIGYDKRNVSLSRGHNIRTHDSQKKTHVHLVLSSEMSKILNNQPYWAYTLLET